ncbi:MAG: hypothetical protein U1E89_14985 [Burkholderiaceae bacterium]
MEADEQGDAIGSGQPTKATTTKSMAKTPTWQAMHASRYRRQDLIRQIQSLTNRKLICYTAGQEADICRDDVLGFVDLLHNADRGASLDLMLHTPGGDIDAAEKLITMVRNVVGAETLRVIVPDFAKSAGTLMALGADVILMSDSSELGPIDPQITLADGEGNRTTYPVQSYLDAFEQHSKALQANPQDEVARMMMGKFEPARLKVFEAARERARVFAGAQLQQGMFRAPKVGPWTAIVDKLLDTNRWQSHGQMIGYADAKALELSVEYIDPREEPWQSLMQLYCYQRLEIKEKQKLFESEFVCLTFDQPA